MMMNEPVIQHVRLSDHASMVSVRGKLTMVQVPEVHRRLIDISAGERNHLIVDLSGVDYLDSAAVGMLVDVYKHAKAARSRLSLVGMRDLVRSVFEITQLDHVFSIYPSKEEALRS